MKYLIVFLAIILSSCSLGGALIQSKGALEKCEQGHSQDRIDCRKKKQTQVDELNKSINKQIEH